VCLLRAPLPLTSGSHHFRDVNARSLRAVGLRGRGIMAHSRCQRFAQIKFKPDDGGQSRPNHDDPDSHEVSSRRACFHGSSVVIHRLKVLIERICWLIDGNDGCRCSLPLRRRQHRKPGAGPASPGWPRLPSRWRQHPAASFLDFYCIQLIMFSCESGFRSRSPSCW